jgi:hypothetical protein
MTNIEYIKVKSKAKAKAKGKGKSKAKASTTVVIKLGRGSSKKGSKKTNPALQKQQQPIIINNVMSPASVPESTRILREQEQQPQSQPIYQPQAQPITIHNNNSAPLSQTTPYMPSAIQIPSNVPTAPQPSSFNAPTTNQINAMENLRNDTLNHIDEVMHQAQQELPPSVAGQFVNHLRDVRAHQQNWYNNGIEVRRHNITATNDQQIPTPPVEPPPMVVPDTTPVPPPAVAPVQPASPVLPPPQEAPAQPPSPVIPPPQPSSPSSATSMSSSSSSSSSSSPPSPPANAENVAMSQPPPTEPIVPIPPTLPPIRISQPQPQPPPQPSPVVRDPNAEGQRHMNNLANNNHFGTDGDEMVHKFLNPVNEAEQIPAHAGNHAVGGGASTSSSSYHTEPPMQYVNESGNTQPRRANSGESVENVLHTINEDEPEVIQPNNAPPRVVASSAPPPPPPPPPPSALVSEDSLASVRTPRTADFDANDLAYIALFDEMPPTPSSSGSNATSSTGRSSADLMNSLDREHGQNLDTPSTGRSSADLINSLDNEYDREFESDDDVSELSSLMSNIRIAPENVLSNPRRRRAETPLSAGSIGVTRPKTKRK